MITSVSCKNEIELVVSTDEPTNESAEIAAEFDDAEVGNVERAIVRAVLGGRHDRAEELRAILVRRRDVDDIRIIRAAKCAR